MNLANQIRFETDCPGDTIHLHNEMELFYTLQGRCAVFADQQNYVLKPEDFAVFNPFSSHQLYREEGAHTLSLYIPIHLLNQAGVGTVHCISPLQPEKQVNLGLIRGRLAEMFRDYTEVPASRRLNLFAELLELLSILQQDFSAAPADMADAESSSHVLRKLERRQQILSYIWEHYQEPITLKSTAAQFFLSEGHFSRLFQEFSGKPFSEYLRSVRLTNARQTLLASDATVTDAALSSGFGNINTFIDAFRREYGMTPGHFLKNAQKELQPFTPDELPVTANTETISYMSLLRHRTSETKNNLLRLSGSDSIHADLSAPGTPLDPIWKKMVGGSYARDLLFAVVQNSLRRGAREIGFDGYLLHGIFQDELGVCKRNPDGTLRFNFVYLDLIFKFLVEDLHTTPWFMLDYTPRCLVTDGELCPFGDHIMNLPSDLSEWTQLITATLGHLISLYGKKEVSSWKFSMEQAMQVSVGNCDLDEYKQFYLATFRAIRHMLPNAEIFGFGFDTGYVALPGNTELEELLEFSVEHNCLPDLLSFQCFFCDYSAFVGASVDINNTSEEVYPISENPDILSKELSQIQALLDRMHLSIPLAITVSSPGMWGRAPGNDTCFVAASIVKNALENRHRLSVFSGGGLTDYPETLLPTNTMYRGGSGLITYNGVPKAAYFSLMLLSRLKGLVIAEGSGYFLTRSESGSEFYLLLYHYCPYNLARHRTTALTPEEEQNYDRYYEFDDKGAKSVHVYLRGLPQAPIHLETHSVTREHGSSYDVWQKMGAPIHPDQNLLNYLEYRSVPDITTETATPSPDGDPTLSFLLEPHEVRVIHGTGESE